MFKCSGQCLHNAAYLHVLAHLHTYADTLFLLCRLKHVEFLVISLD